MGIFTYLRDVDNLATDATVSATTEGYEFWSGQS